MTISNIWTNEEYRDKMKKLMEDKNVFEVNQFLERHQFRDIDNQTEENTNDHDITVIDEITLEVFIEHLDCYFTD